MIAIIVETIVVNQTPPYQASVSQVVYDLKNLRKPVADEAINNAKNIPLRESAPGLSIYRTVTFL